jgi:hypothetical protein
MNRAEQRSELRVPITHRGTLGVPGVSFPCLTQDFSSSGFGIMCTISFDVGDVLDFQCELYPECHLKCKVEVRHVADAFLGTRVVEISDAGRKLCSRFIEEHLSIKRFEYGTPSRAH